MTNPQDAWVEVERRAALGQDQGVAGGTDDLLNALDLEEASIDPNKRGGKGAGGSGSGMMPPMMMGGARGGG